MYKQVLLFIFCVSNLYGQSMREAFERAIQQSILDGTYQEAGCGNSSRDFPHFNDGRACNSNNGYGTNGWQPASNNGGANAFDIINCTVPTTPVPACGFYRIPLALVIFENSAHIGTNYLNGAGFASLTDVDINSALVQLNSLYANAKIEFYEAVPRRRVTNADMYDFYTPFLGGPDPATAPNNGLDDDPETAAFDVPGIINLYFVGGLNGDHDASGITGYAPYPPSRNYSIMAYRALFGSTLFHELGHYLGLHHTHNNQGTGNDNPQFPPDDALNNSDCLTKGDKICDTWPDPTFDGCNQPSCVYKTTPSPPCGVLTIAPASGTNYGGGVSTILQRNIMSYNSFGSCRQDFSPCQYKKLQDVLLNCRNNLCDTAVSRHFNSTALNNVQSPYKEICVGQAIPTFTAKSACYNWYLVPTAGAPVATGTASFTPTAAQLNVNTAGTTLFYIEEVNAYNTACRQIVRVVVSPRPGNGINVADGTATVLLTGSGTETVTVNTTAAALAANQIVGWWLTVDNPISTSVTNQTTLNSALGSATVGGAVSSSTPNQVFEATVGVPATQLALGLDCSVLDPSKDYFLTPFVSGKRAAIADANCTVNFGPGGIGTFNGFAAKSRSLSAAAVTCRPASPFAPPTFTISFTVAGYTGAANNLGLRIRNGSCGGTSMISQTIAGNGNYTFTQANFAAGYDPGVDGFCIIAFENSGAGMSAATLTASINITYPGLPAINFPTVVYNNCLFGTPVQANCPNIIPVSVGAGCTSGSVNGVTGNSWFPVLDGSSKLIAAINPGTNNLGTVTVQVNDMAAVPLDGDNKHYLPRYWNFESSNFAGIASPFPSGNISVRIYLLDAELTAYNTAAGLSATAAQLNLTHYAGSNEDCNILNNNYSTAILEMINSGSIAATSYNTTSGNGYQLQFSLSHFSEIGASGSPILLAEAPILSFRAQAKDRTVDLFWSVNTDAKAAKFDIEHSVDAANFTSIGVLPVLSSDQFSFNFNHSAPIQGNNYYRLKMYSRDGAESYSKILNQAFDMQSTISIIPNPAQAECTLIYFSDVATENDLLEVYDLSGKLVFKQNAVSKEGMNYITLQTEMLPAGVYTLRLQQKTNSRVLRFVKE
jgi:hypothetical protein